MNNIHLITIICLLLLLILAATAILIYRTLRKRTYYRTILSTLQHLDRKYLLPEMLPPADFREARILEQILYETDKSMHEQISQRDAHLADFRDYIDLWVHEVKTPLSALQLSLRGSDRSSKSYIQDIESYIDQALYYSKLDTSDKDYIIKKLPLEPLIQSIIKANKNALIEHHIKIHLSGFHSESKTSESEKFLEGASLAPSRQAGAASEKNFSDPEVLDSGTIAVYSDPKWLAFIIGQILSNAIKYRRAKNPEITITAKATKSHTTLTIHDNGIGIKPSELPRVFQRGFTGTNDRTTKTSTGMGLYIAHQLATDLGHTLTITSTPERYTELTLRLGTNPHLHPR